METQIYTCGRCGRPAIDWKGNPKNRCPKCETEWECETSKTMPKIEYACKQMSDICELAHNRAVREIYQYNKNHKRKIRVNCPFSNKNCDNDEHGDRAFFITHYTKQAQIIFDRHYDLICEHTGL